MLLRATQRVAANGRPLPCHRAQLVVARSLEERYKEAFTMSQIYVKERPEAIPVTEHERRRKVKDFEEIASAGKRLGLDPSVLKSNLGEIDELMPGLINLFKMKAGEWAALARDVNSVAAKLITLKSCYPNADVFKIAAARPRLLLQSDQELVEGASKVKELLSGAQNPDTIIEAVPELSDAGALARSLAFLRTSYPGQAPVALLEKNPRMLLNVGESDVGPSEEYGELSTKD